MRTVKKDEELESISLLSLFSIFKKENIVKTAIITSTFMLFGVLYLLFATPKYISHISLEVDTLNQNIPRENDLISAINLPALTDVETEMDVLNSDLLLSKVLSKISDGVKYFDLNGFKKSEYYKDAPFRVEDIFVTKKSIFNKMFEITPLNEGSYKISEVVSFKDRLKELLPFNKSKRVRLKDKVANYGESVKADGVEFKVIKNGTIKKGRYGFYIMYQPNFIKDTRKNLNIRPASARSSVITVYYEDTDPYRVRDFLNILSREYINQNIYKKAKNASMTLNFLDSELLKVKKQLESSSNRLREYKERNNLIDIDTNSQLVIDKLVEYDREYARAKLQYRSFLALKKDLERGNYSAVAGFSDEYPILEGVVEELQTALNERATLLSNFTANHPDVIAVDRRISSIKRSIRNIVNGIESTLKKSFMEYETLVKRESGELKSLPQKEQDLANLQRLFSVNENLFSYLLQRHSELSLIKASKVSDVRVLDVANVELRPSKPNKTIVLMTSLFLGLFFSLLASLIKFKRVINREEDIKAITDIPIFGIIPYVKDREKYNKAYVLSDPSSGASEAFRAVRENLTYMVTNNRSKVLLLSSMMPNEGKTVTSANLAATLSMGDKSVILLSVDLRKPELHKKFGLPNRVGMSELLANKADLKEVLWQHNRYKNLHIITSGQIPPNPAELISSDRMAELIRELRSMFDYIVIDTPPINYVSDAISLFKYADINLFVFRSEYSRESSVIELDRLTKRLEIENVGIILNGVKKRYTNKRYFDERYISKKVSLSG
jgi:capsular exopolysaccharide synthesis family protein